MRRLFARRPIAAFTLAEVLAAVALMGLLALALGWSLTGDARRARQSDVIGRIAQADRMARLAAARLGTPCALRFDLDRQRLGRVEWDAERGERPARGLRLPAPYRIDRVLVCSTARPELGTGNSELGTGNPSSWIGAARTDWGAVDIAYSTAGRSATYAVRLAAKDARGFKTAADAPDDRPTWLVFSGLTGQMVVLHNEDEIEDLFAALTTGGAP